LGVSTFIPASGFPSNFIGYSSIDPFTLISAVILWVISGIVYWYGKKKEKTPACRSVDRESKRIVEK
jgi:hypothetical protein